MPSYLRIPVILIGLSALYILLDFGRPILIPISLAVLFSFGIYPVFAFLMRRGLPEVPAILISVLSVLVVLAGILVLVIFQLIHLMEDAPRYGEQMETHYYNLQMFIERQFGIQAENQTEYLKNQAIDYMNQLPALVVGLFSTGFNLLIFILLVAIFTFFFIYYRNEFSRFINTMFPRVTKQGLQDLVFDTYGIIRNYLAGVGTVMLVIAMLNTIALYFIGIEHPLFFGCVSALLNLIPYIGVLIGATIPILFALLTKDSLFYPIAVMVTFDLIQYLEGNLITPRVVGHRVHLNPIAVIFVVLIGGVVWGAAGMIFSVPFLAIFKIVIDSQKIMQPLSRLITGSEKSGDGVLARLIGVIRQKIFRVNTGTK